MRLTRVGLLAVLGIVLHAKLMGCATSIQPLSSKDVLTDGVTIEGEWKVSHSHYTFLSKGAHVVVTRRSTGRYDVEVERDGKPMLWQADVVALGEETYVDLFPKVDSDPDQSPETALRLSTHVIFALTQDQGTLKLQTFDVARLEAQARQQGLTVPIENADGNGVRVVFVADAKTLQAFFQKHGAALRSPEPCFVLERR